MTNQGFSFSTSSQLNWVFWWPSLAPRNQRSFLLPLLFIIFCIFAGPRSSNYQPEPPQWCTAKHGENNYIMLWRTGTSEVQTRGNPQEALLLGWLALAWHPHWPLLQLLKGKWSSEGKSEQEEHEGFADTNRQFLLQIWGETEERLGLFESIAVRGRYLGS